MPRRKNARANGDKYPVDLAPPDVLLLQHYYNIQRYVIINLLICILPLFSCPTADFVFLALGFRKIIVSSYDEGFNKDYIAMQQSFVPLLEGFPPVLVADAGLLQPLPEYIAALDRIISVVKSSALKFNASVHSFYNPYFPYNIGLRRAVELDRKIVKETSGDPGECSADLHKIYHYCLYIVTKHYVRLCSGFFGFVNVASHALSAGCFFALSMKLLSPIFDINQATAADAVTDCDVKFVSCFQAFCFGAKLFFLYAYSVGVFSGMFEEDNSEYGTFVEDKLSNKEVYIFMVILGFSAYDIYMYFRNSVQQCFRQQMLEGIKYVARELPVTLIAPSDISSTALIIPKTEDLSISLLAHLFFQSGIISVENPSGVFVPLQFITLSQVAKLRDLFASGQIARQKLHDFVILCRDSLKDYFAKAPVHVVIDQVTNKIMISLISCSADHLRQLKVYLLANGCINGKYYTDLEISDPKHFDIKALCGFIATIEESTVLSNKISPRQQGSSSSSVNAEFVPGRTHKKIKRNSRVAPQMSASQSFASTSPVEGSEIQYRFEFHRKIKHLLESNSVLRRKVLHAQEDVLRVKIGRLYGLRDFDIELKLPGLGIRFFGNMRRKGDLVTYDFTRCQFNHLRQK